MKKYILSKERMSCCDRNKACIRLFIAAFLMLPMSLQAIGSATNLKTSIRNEPGFNTILSASDLLAPITVTGTVVDDSNNPLPGVTVKTKDGSVTTVTDANGKFTINVEANTTLVISFIGFDSQEVTATEAVMNVRLLPATGSLDEVVVVGYGTQKEKPLRGQYQQ